MLEVGVVVGVLVLVVLGAVHCASHGMSSSTSWMVSSHDTSARELSFGST